MARMMKSYRCIRLIVQEAVLVVAGAYRNAPNLLAGDFGPDSSSVMSSLDVVWTVRESVPF